MNNTNDDLIRQAMSQLAKRRWANTTPRQRRKALASVRAARNLDADQRAAVGRRLAAARAAARNKRKDLRPDDEKSADI